MNFELMVSSVDLVHQRTETGFATWVGLGGDVCTTITAKALTLDSVSFRDALDAHRKAVASTVARRSKWRKWRASVMNGGVLAVAFLGLNTNLELEGLEPTYGYWAHMIGIYVLEIVLAMLSTLLLDRVSRKLVAVVLRRALGS
jgi:hypothetical protein